VVNVSDVGLLAEGEMRLLPGTHVEVHLMTADGRLLIRSRVVRAFVCQVSAGQIRYRGAVAFDRVVQTTFAGYAIPGAAGGPAAPPGSTYPDSSIPSTPTAGNGASA
jgi:hypothetical protein